MVGIAGFAHDGRQQVASMSLDRVGELLIEGSSVRLSSAFCDGYIGCVSGSLAFHDLQPYIAADLAVWLDGEIYDFGGFAGDIKPSENAMAILATLYRRY